MIKGHWLFLVLSVNSFSFGNFQFAGNKNFHHSRNFKSQQKGYVIQPSLLPPPGNRPQQPLKNLPPLLSPYPINANENFDDEIQPSLLPPSSPRIRPQLPLRNNLPPAFLPTSISTNVIRTPIIIAADDVAAPNLPTIKARINQPTFEYLSRLMVPIIDTQIKQARIPPIFTCPPILDGCVQITNIFVSRYRCPQKVSIYPSPPDQLVVAVENVDFGITGNLGGYIKIIKRKLFGLAHVNVQQTSIIVKVKINKSPNGGPFIEMVDCKVDVGYVDAIIEHGGLLGIVANDFLRGFVNKQAKDLIPGKVCETIPLMINEKINSRLAQLPRGMALAQLLHGIGGPLSFNDDDISDGCGIEYKLKAAGKTPKVHNPLKLPSKPKNQTTAPKPKLQQINRPFAKPLPPLPSTHIANTSPKFYVPLHGSKINIHRKSPFTVFSAREDQQIRNSMSSQAKAFAANIQLIERGETSPCIACSGVGPLPSPICQLKEFLRFFDPTKLNDINLAIQLLGTYASNNDFSIDLDGEFFSNSPSQIASERYFMHFPRKVGVRMAEALISDFSINTLLYVLTKKGFFTFNLGPETPKIGNFLRTTCSFDDLQDYGVEYESDQRSSSSSLLNILRQRRHPRQTTTSLTDFGICLGDVLPSAQQNYPNQDITIQIYLDQYPQLTLSSIKGGTAILGLVANADLTTNFGVSLGNLRIVADVEAQLKFGNNEIIGRCDITRFMITNPDGLLDMSQSTLDKIRDIGEEIIEKTINEILQNGIPLEISTANTEIPIDLIEPQFKIIEHAIHFETDFVVSPSLFKEVANNPGSCRR